MKGAGTSEIVKIVAQAFQEGLRVDEQTLFFAESTYGITSSTFAAALADEHFDDRDLLLSLLFFPPERTRQAVESVLSGAALSIHECEDVVAKVEDSVTTVNLALPDGTVFPWIAGHDIVTHFVDKLYMTRRLDQSMSTALDRYLSKEQAVETKVVMRCNNMNCADDARTVLIRFIEKGADRTKDFLKLFTLLLTNASHLPPNKRFVDYLFEQRDHQKKRFHDIRTFEKKASHYGMEYLMMQKYPVPHESEDHVRELLASYTIILDQVLHLQDLRETYLTRRDLGTFDSTDDLQQLFRSLS